MKRITALILSLLLMLCLFGCAEDNEEGEKEYITVTEYSLKKDITLGDMADQISDKFSVSMPMEVSDKTLENLFYIAPTAVEEYAGIFSISMSSADNIIIVRPQKGKSAVVKYGFEQRKQDIIDTFTGYLEASLTQAENSFVLERDGLYIYACLDAEAAEVEEFINTFFDITEKQVEVEVTEKTDDTQEDSGENIPGEDETSVPDEGNSEQNVSE